MPFRCAHCSTSLAERIRGRAVCPVCRQPGPDRASSERPTFDPGDHTVPEVCAYLERADDDERERVLSAERAGKARAGVLGRLAATEARR